MVGMAVPKASVNEDHFSAPGKHQIWPAWQSASVKPVAISERRDYSPDPQLRHSVTARNASHPQAAFLAGKCVHRSRLQPKHSLDTEFGCGVLHHPSCSILAKPSDRAEQYGGERSPRWLLKSSLMK